MQDDIETPNGFTVTPMKSFPAGSNPYHHDHFRQGLAINGSDFDEDKNEWISSEKWMIMWGMAPDDIVLVHMATGKRLMVKVR